MPDEGSLELGSSGGNSCGDEAVMMETLKNFLQFPPYKRERQDEEIGKTQKQKAF